MRTVNRVAVVVSPREPFRAWARSLEDASPIDELPLADLTTVYLAEAEEPVEAESVIRRHFAAIFEEQLVGWHRVASAWPTPRTYVLFREWFDVSVIELVFDLADRPLVHLDE
jgi:hypothetical protein